MDLELLENTIDQMREGDDRVCCVVACATFEEITKKLLEKKLIGKTKDIFSDNGPLVTLSSRIDMCFHLGLISKNECHDLNLIRKCRNQFAHSFDKQISFSNNKIQNWILAMEGWKNLEMTDDSGFGIKMKFVITVAMRQIQLTSSRSFIERVKPLDELKAIRVIEGNKPLPGFNESVFLGKIKD